MTPQEIIEWSGAIGIVVLCITVCVMLACFAVELIRDTWSGK